VTLAAALPWENAAGEDIAPTGDEEPRRQTVWPDYQCGQVIEKYSRTVLAWDKKVKRCYFLKNEGRKLLKTKDRTSKRN
jgi:hypothetical protein